MFLFADKQKKTVRVFIRALAPKKNAFFDQSARPFWDVLALFFDQKSAFFDQSARPFLASPRALFFFERLLELLVSIFR